MKTSSKVAKASIDYVPTFQIETREVVGSPINADGTITIYSDDASRIKGKSKTTVYLLTDTCPTCDERSRKDLEQVQSLCRWSNRQGLHISLVVVMQGNTLWRPLYELLQLDMSEPAIPAYYHDGNWYRDSSGLVSPIQKEVTQWASRK